VTFDERLDRAVELNARGALRALELARDAGGVPLVHVSTCFVSGRRRGPIPVIDRGAVGRPQERRKRQSLSRWLDQRRGRG
jgi:nucleoside-diphosphate-sugar epimerase